MKCLKACLIAVAVLALPWSSALGQEKDQREPFVDIDAESASHEEIEPLAIEFQRLSALALSPDGVLLAGDWEAEQIKRIDPAGKLLDTIELEFGPESIDVAPDGTIYCGGQGRLARLDKTGKLLKTVDVPENAATPPSEMRRAWSQPQRISGIAVSGNDLFVAFGSGWSLGSKSKLFRFNRELEDPQLLAEGLRGCCQRCDCAARDGVLYLAENSAHRVVRYDRQGEVLGKWGARSRTEIEGFGACCNPMNLAFDSRGVLYTAESGLGRVKRYAPDGKFLGLVGYAGTERFERAGHLAASCSNIAIAVTPDGKRVYVMDYKENLVRVLQEKK